MSDAAAQSVDTPAVHSSPSPSPDAPDAPGAQEPESPTARAADAARAVEAPSRDLDGRESQAPGDPARADDNQVDDSDSAIDGDGDSDDDSDRDRDSDGDGDGEHVTSPRLEHLQETIDDAKEAAQRALGSTPEVDTSAKA